MSCRSTCACQCQNSACGCLSPGKQPPPRSKTEADRTGYRSETPTSTTPETPRSTTP